MKQSSKDKRKAFWMIQFKDTIISLKPQYTGKIDWNSAIYLYNTGIDANIAAQKYIENKEIA